MQNFLNNDTPEIFFFHAKNAFQIVLRMNLIVFFYRIIRRAKALFISNKSVVISLRIT